MYTHTHTHTITHTQPHTHNHNTHTHTHTHTAHTRCLLIEPIVFDTLLQCRFNPSHKLKKNDSKSKIAQARPQKTSNNTYNNSDHCVTVKSVSTLHPVQISFSLAIYANLLDVCRDPPASTATTAHTHTHTHTHTYVDDTPRSDVPSPLTDSPHIQHSLEDTKHVQKKVCACVCVCVLYC